MKTLFALLSETEYKYWNILNAWLLDFPKDGTLFYNTEDPEKDINSLCIMPFMVDLQLAMITRADELSFALERDGMQLPNLVESYDKAITEIV